MQSTSRILAMRDFFLATDGREMAQAFTRLTACLPPMPHPSIDWDEVEFDFNRLFVGPQSLTAPPYASVYLDPEPILMGKTTLKVRSIYEAIGLSSPWEGSLPDDHIGLELDAAAVFKLTLEKKHNQELEDLWRYFLTDHMAVWLPRFGQRILDDSSIQPVFTVIVAQLLDWLESELSAVAPSQTN